VPVHRLAIKLLLPVVRGVSTLCVPELPWLAIAVEVLLDLSKENSVVLFFSLLV